MKKLSLLLVCSLFLLSCDVNDDGPRPVIVNAEVIEIDVPEFFEAGKTYDIDVTYLLPDACHTNAGINPQRGSNSNGEDEYRDIYVAGLASYDANITAECDVEADEEDLERESTFKMTIGDNEDEPYTFYLWTGLDEDDKNIFIEVVVPVGEPEETEEEAAE